MRGVALKRPTRRREPSQRQNREALDNVRGAPEDTSSSANRSQWYAFHLPAGSAPWTKPDVPRAAEPDASASVPQTRCRVRKRRGGRLRRRGSEAEQRERGVTANKTEAAARTEKRQVLWYELDLPADSKCRAVETEGAAPRKKLVGDAVSGEGPTGMGVSTVAEAYSHSYYGATPGVGLGKKRVLAARFEQLAEFMRRDACAKVPIEEGSEKTCTTAHLCEMGRREER